MFSLLELDKSARHCGVPSTDVGSTLGEQEYSGGFSQSTLAGEHLDIIG